MSKNSQRRALLLAAIVPALLVAGCSAGTTQAMQGVASPVPPTEMESPGMSPDMSPTDQAPATDPRTAVQNYFSALKSGNVDQVVDSFADDAVVAWDGEPTAEGTQAIRRLYQQQAEGQKEATHTIDEARTAGNENGVVRATSKQDNETHRELFVLTQDGGEWKISELMTNQQS
ncbi:nuclear transport factor 2 family protein [Nonomuraea terrae]|uniref:Nuclear transport factor 2 family protein n=1 Tax=Nonomuraea terrae TaxID=2530383 RepID=A0A4R4Y5A1_9ACTN|nr:nuclear transport factor 2 family protein [Nonomuraea terrae]TDD39376.1 nuclear transport factor 2 family protein [Nonomuraea terrae]